MAYEIKGDANVKRDLTAGRRISADLALNSPDWVTLSDYLVNDIIVSGGKAYMCSTAHTAAAAFITDGANWDEMSGETLPYWSATTDYLVGDIVITASATSSHITIFKCTVAHTSAAAFDSADQANWFTASEFSLARVFLAEATVGPALAGEPTLAEIVALKGAGLALENVREAILYYTGTATSTDTPTYVYHIDTSGNITEVSNPGLREVVLTDDTTGPIAWQEGRFDAYLNMAGAGVRTISLPTSPISGGIYSLIVLNSTGVATDLDLSAFKDELGVALSATTTVAIGERAEFTFHYNGADFRQIVYAGGLEKKGVVIAAPAPASEGIYNVDAGAGAFNFNLPAATGTQERIIIVADDVETNNVTIAVQPGENMNGTLNGTKLITANGSQYHAIDRSTGNWEIVKLGVEGGSDVSISLATWTATNAAETETSSNLDIAAVLLSDQSATNIGTYTSTLNLPSTIAQNVSFKFVKDATKLNSAAIQVSGGGDTSIVYINTATGATTTSFTGTVAAPSVSSNITDNTVELSIEFPFSANYTAWSISPAWGANTSPGTQVVAQTGTLEVIELNMNASATAAGGVTGSYSLVHNPNGSMVNGTVVPFLTEQASSGTNVTFNNTTDKWTLQAGSTYKCTASISQSAGTVAAAVWYDETGATAFGEPLANYVISFAGTVGEQPMAMGYITPTVTTVIYLQAQAIFTMNGSGFANVEEVSATAVDTTLLTPTALHYGRLSKTDGVSQDSNAQLTFNEATYSSGMTLSTATNSITATQNGRYKIEVMAGFGDINVDYDIEIRKNGTAIETFSVDSAGATDGPASFSYDADLVATDVITIQLVSGGDLVTFVGLGTTAYLDVRQLPNSTVVDPEDMIVDDQAASGYMDFGAMRLQWGVNTQGTGHRTVILPAAFLNTSYIVTGVPVGPVSNTGSAIAFNGEAGSKTTASFEGEVVFTNASATGLAGEDFNWFAIGLKP